LEGWFKSTPDPAGSGGVSVKHTKVISVVGPAGSTDTFMNKPLTKGTQVWTISDQKVITAWIVRPDTCKDINRYVVKLSPKGRVEHFYPVSWIYTTEAKACKVLLKELKSDLKFGKIWVQKSQRALDEAVLDLADSKRRLNEQQAWIRFYENKISKLSGNS
jgi:hypothetical protein